MAPSRCASRWSASGGTRFHASGVLDQLMERFRAISTDPEKCPGGLVSWKQNLNHIGQALRKEVKQRQFNEALALLAETEGRLIEKDPPVWQR